MCIHSYFSEVFHFSILTHAFLSSFRLIQILFLENNQIHILIRTRKKKLKWSKYSRKHIRKIKWIVFAYKLIRYMCGGDGNFGTWVTFWWYEVSTILLKTIDWCKMEYLLIGCEGMNSCKIFFNLFFVKTR